MKLKLLIISLLLFANTFAQNINPDFGEEYIQDYLPSIEVTMNQADYDWMVHPDNILSDEYQHCTIIYKGSNSQVVTYSDLGIRLRGNTSRKKNKKSFKLHFEKFIDGQKFFGLKKLNLKAEVNDPTLVREHLTMNMFRESNVPVARVNHIKFYINGNYMGLYSNVEQIDKTFLEARFANKDGNLYKCSWGADLNDPSKVYDNGIYELKTNEVLNDRAKLLEFVDFLKNAYHGLFEANIESYFNVDTFIKQLAVEVLSGHWDGYSYNKNNFYLYYNIATEKFEWIPYDTDNTIGIDWMGRDWTERNIYDWAKHGDSGRPLYTRILGIEKYQIQFSREINELLKNRFTVDYQMNYAYQYKDLISDAVYTDQYYSQDYGFSLDDFENSYTQNFSNHVKYGLGPYIEKRSKTASEQLDYSHLSINDNLFSSNWTLYPLPLQMGSSLNLSIDDSSISRVNIQLLDSSGRVVHHEEIDIENKTSSIDLSRFKSGMYFMQLKDLNSSKIAVKKLIIQ